MSNLFLVDHGTGKCDQCDPVDVKDYFMYMCHGKSEFCEIHNVDRECLNIPEHSCSGIDNYLEVQYTCKSSMTTPDATTTKSTTDYTTLDTTTYHISHTSTTGETTTGTRFGSKMRINYS